jgi:small-conductance mechanosensitive channel
METGLHTHSRERPHYVRDHQVSLVKLTILLLALAAVLSDWGYNATTIIAGLGVGSIALALAAQKTIGNFFGSVSVISDRPVSVGDFCRFGDRAGTVEDIGTHSEVETGALPVRFVGVGTYSLDVEIFAYVLTREGDEFLQLQQDLLLQILDSVEHAGTALALPTQASINYSPNEAVAPELVPAGRR